MKNNLLNEIYKIQKKKILCIGDIILDSYINNKLIKISEEDPINVIKKENQFFKLGGVGNVALNLKNFGTSVDLITIGSYDKSFKVIKKLLSENKIKSKVFYIKNNQTTIKERHYISNYHLLRKDTEKFINLKNSTINQLISYIRKKISQNSYDAIIVSDYGKGLISSKLFSKLSLISNKYKIKLFVDPKSNRLSTYSGSFCIKANNKEMDIFLQKFDLKTNDLLDLNKKSLVKKCLKKEKIKNFIITRSDSDTIFFRNDKNFKINISKIKKLNVVNTTGAGDTFFAVFICFYLVTNNFNYSILKANLFSEFSVKKFGTYAPSLHEIILNILKIKSFELNSDIKFLKKIIQNLKKNKQLKIGFTNGCFDIVHPGHIKLLREAKQNCDILIVGLNSDKSVKMNKGFDRPINNIFSRIEILKSIEYVDMVCVFNEKTPLKLIKNINPDILIKGNDYKNKLIVGEKFVKKNSGKVKLVSMLKNFSSSKIIYKTSKIK